MKQPESFTTRLAVLALLLAFGPLQATATFACEMMETVVHEVCCCDEGSAARGNAGSEQDCNDDMSATATVPCCEHAATVGIDAGSFKATSAQKSANKTSTTPGDIDPPETALVDSLAGPKLSVGVPDSTSPTVAIDPTGDGSTLWLTTRRLRI